MPSDDVYMFEYTPQMVCNSFYTLYRLRNADIRRFVDDVDVLNGGEMALRTHRRDVETIRRDHKVDLLLTEMRVELNHLTRSRTRAHSAHSLDMVTTKNFAIVTGYRISILIMRFGIDRKSYAVY